MLRNKPSPLYSQMFTDNPESQLFHPVSPVPPTGPDHTSATAATLQRAPTASGSGHRPPPTGPLPGSGAACVGQPQSSRGPTSRTRFSRATGPTGMNDSPSPPLRLWRESHYMELCRPSDRTDTGRPTTQDTSAILQASISHRTAVRRHTETAAAGGRSPRRRNPPV